MKINCAIIGNTGHVGRQVESILKEHPKANCTYTFSRKEGEKGELSKTQFVFLCMPHGNSEKYLKSLDGKIIYDASLDHRDSWTYGIPEIFENEIKIRVIL